MGVEEGLTFFGFIDIPDDRGPSGIQTLCGCLLNE